VDGDLAYLTDGAFLNFLQTNRSEYVALWDLGIDLIDEAAHHETFAAGRFD